MNKRNNFLDYTIFSDSLSNLPDRPSTMVNTINQYSYCIAEKDELFKKSLQDSDVLLPDGVGIVWAANLLDKTKFKKIAGADIHEFLLQKLNRESGSCFYLGASTTTLRLIKKKLSNRFPYITVATFSPPYKAIFSEAENEQMISLINQFNPDVLFVGMTAPKQEKWTFEHKHQLNAKFICTIGAVFDFYAGIVNRPSFFWIDNGLEWLARLFNEPKRLAKRYLIYGPVFIFLIFREKIKRF